MSARRQARDDDLALRHAMGFKLHEAHRLWPHVVAFLARHGAVFVTTDWAVRWATPPPHVQPAAWARRLRLVRGFAQYHRTLDPRTELPPPEVLPYRHPRRSPYLYSAAEIARLLAAARHLPSATGLRAHTYATALGLLAVTGMRISELVALENDDVDRGHGLLTRRHTTFGKSRCLPLHPTTRQALCGDVHRRDRGDPIPNTPSFFVAAQGPRVDPLDGAGHVRPHSPASSACGAPPTAMGHVCTTFGHRFAVQTLVRWYREGVDVERHLPALSTAPRAGQGQRYLLVSARHTAVARLGHPTSGAGAQGADVMTTTLSFPSLLEPFFTERLVRQQQASPHTIASYRDPFCLLLRFAQQRLHQAPSALTLADLDAPVHRRVSGVSGTRARYQRP